MELLFQSAKELASNIIHKKVSAVEVVQAFIHQIEKVNPLLNAVVQFFPERALQEAKKADERLMRGNKVGLLHGVPMTIKDTCDVAGFICTMGTQGYKNNLVHTDATAVARLKQAGAIILGITNMPECAIAFESDNLNYGRTNNPYDLKRTPGGSSGGEGAIIAAGGSPLGLGGDGGGSIRVPAHFCGIAGIKPTQGHIPQTGLLIPRDGVGIPSIVGALGPLARYVDDLDLALQVLCGPDNHDPHTVPMNLNDFHKVNLASLKVGFYVNNGVKNPSKDIQDAVIKAAMFMAQDVKASVEEIQPKHMKYSYELLWELYFEGGDGAVGFQQFLKSIGTKQFSSLLTQFLSSAERHKLASITEFQNKLIRADQMRFDLTAYLSNYDVIICPPCATVAKLHGTTFAEIEDFTYTMTYNLLGWPAAVVRVGQTEQHLPIGVQVVAKPWREDVALAVAKSLEQQFGGWRIPKL